MLAVLQSIVMPFGSRLAVPRQCRLVTLTMPSRPITSSIRSRTLERTLFSLQPDEVHLWIFRLDQVTDLGLLDTCQALLDQDEIERYSRFHFKEHRQQFLLSHALVRITLSRYAQVEPEAWHFVTNVYGRPEIANREFAWLRFNLSHTNGKAVCAIASYLDVGVDVEDCWRLDQIMEVADLLFTSEELAVLNALPAEHQRARFFEYWTLKEAYLKARGLGLNLPLSKFAFDIKPRRPCISFDPDLVDHPEAWQFIRMWLSERHHVAVAVRRPRGLPVTVRVNGLMLPSLEPIPVGIAVR
jgi:4'-phosphopantetheinyl transferase